MFAPSCRLSIWLRDKTVPNADDVWRAHVRLPVGLDALRIPCERREPAAGPHRDRAEDRVRGAEGRPRRRFHDSRGDGAQSHGAAAVRSRRAGGGGKQARAPGWRIAGGFRERASSGQFTGGALPFILRESIARRDVAQPGSASALGADGRRFESARPDQFHLSGHRATAGVSPTGVYARAGGRSAFDRSPEISCDRTAARSIPNNANFRNSRRTRISRLSFEYRRDAVLRGVDPRRRACFQAFSMCHDTNHGPGIRPGSFNEVTTGRQLSPSMPGRSGACESP